MGPWLKDSAAPIVAVMVVVAPKVKQGACCAYDE